MHHATPLITTIVGGCSSPYPRQLANESTTSLWSGYLLAGVLAGPFTPGFVADTSLRRNWLNWALFC
ncbi:hypothetical protein ACNKHM_04560 [Shigella sonnei]